MDDRMAAIVGQTALHHPTEKEVEACQLKDRLDGAIVGLYFSAHWCPPCRGFTPTLVKFYSNLRAKGQKFEIIFVSSDSDQDSFKEYYNSMPWLAFPLGDVRKDKLAAKYSVGGIPALVLLGPDGETITTQGRSFVLKDPKGDDFPWRGQEPPASPMDASALIRLAVLLLFVYSAYKWLSASPPSP